MVPLATSHYVVAMFNCFYEAIGEHTILMIQQKRFAKCFCLFVGGRQFSFQFETPAGYNSGVVRTKNYFQIFVNVELLIQNDNSQTKSCIFLPWFSVVMGRVQNSSGSG